MMMGGYPTGPMMMGGYPTGPMMMASGAQPGFGQFMLNQLQNLAEQTKTDKPLNKDKQ